MNTPDLVRRLESLRSYITGLSAEAPAIRNQAAILINDTIAALAPGAAVEVPKPAAKALEFAEYLARGAERLLEALNAEDELGIEMEDDPGGTELAERFYAARDMRCEYVTGLNADVYEFRKRAEKSTRAAPPPAGADGAVGVAP